METRSITCICGVRSRVRVTAAGQRLRCPNCKAILIVHCGCGKRLSLVGVPVGSSGRCPGCMRRHLPPFQSAPGATSKISQRNSVKGPPTPHENSLKVCIKCDIPKPANRSFFGSNRVGNLRGRCRSCDNEATRQHAEQRPDLKAGREKRRQNRQGGFVATRVLKLALIDDQGSLCALCGGDLSGIGEADVDHLLPLSLGGSNSESNLVVAHRRCNKEKSGKSLADYEAWRARVGLEANSYTSYKIVSARNCAQY